MILALFLVILAISLLLMWFGEYTEEGIYSFGGLLFLFFIGITILLPANLQIPNGENVTISTNNTTGITTENHVPNYTDFSDTFSHSMGFWLSLIAVFGFSIKLTQIRSGMKKDD
jgi:hypothetical protein